MGSDYWLAWGALFAIGLLLVFGGCMSGGVIAYKHGYIRALQDMKHGKTPAYVLVEQPDGTTKWESNKEKGK